MVGFAMGQPPMWNVCAISDNPDDDWLTCLKNAMFLSAESERDRIY
jgi:hypothetical protein